MPKQPSKAECIRDLKRTQVALYGENSHKLITRDKYREYGAVPERQWRVIFGSFQEFRRKAKLEINKATSKFLSHIRKHSEVDELREFNEERKCWGERYLRKNKARYQLLIGSADWHDLDTDPFVLRVFLDTLKRTQPDIITFAGDVYGHSEFGKYHTDPREWQPVKRMQYVNTNILGASRRACPNAQIDLVEGNHSSRILKHLITSSPATQVFLSDWLGLTVKDMLKLDEYEINYIAKSDLTAWTKQAEAEELAKNYKIYFDCVLVHHYTHMGKPMGFPGFSGHNHKHLVYSEYSPQFGAYEWHQIGCCCRRNADYTNGLKWANGFILVHIDTKLKLTNFEYVPITDHACVGGKYYYRNKNEVVTPGWK